MARSCTFFPSFASSTCSPCAKAATGKDATAARARSRLSLFMRNSFRLEYDVGVERQEHRGPGHARLARAQHTTCAIEPGGRRLRGSPDVRRREHRPAQVSLRRVVAVLFEQPLQLAGGLERG